MRTAQAGLVPGFAHHFQPFDEYGWRLGPWKGRPGAAADQVSAPTAA